MFQVSNLSGNGQYSVKIGKYKIKWDKAPSEIQLKFQNKIYPFWGADIVLAEYRIPGSLLRLDIFNVSRKIILEISPSSSHGSFNKFFHSNRSGYLNSIKRDFKKVKWAQLNKIKFVELSEKDLRISELDLMDKIYA